MIRMETHGLMDLAQGLKDMETELVALGANEGRKVLTRAARVAFKPVQEAAQAAAPVDTGLLRENIAIVTQKPKDGASVVNVGLRIRKSKETRISKHGVSKGGTHRLSTSPHWRWHFIEGGTSTTPARPFLRPALDANAEKVVAGLNGELRKAIDRVLKKRKKEGVKGAVKRAAAEAKGYAKAGLKGLRKGFR
jgi:HK97 gp10 family phage protein